MENQGQMNADDLQEVYLTPDQVLATQDHEIAVLLRRASANLMGPIEVVLMQAVAYQQAKIKTLVHERDRQAGMLDAVSEGQQAKGEGKMLSENPYVPDEDDCKWIYWQTGWAAG